MPTNQELPEVRVIAARYERAKKHYEQVRDELRGAVVEQLRAGARPADLARATGWDREYLRRIRAAADEADAKAAAQDQPAS